MNQSDIDAFLDRIEKVKNEPQRLERLQAINFGWENTLGCLMEAYLKFSRFITKDGEIVKSVAVVELEDIVSYYIRARYQYGVYRTCSTDFTSNNILISEFERLRFLLSKSRHCFDPKSVSFEELNEFMFGIETRVKMIIESCLQIERELKQDDRQLSML